MKRILAILVLVVSMAIGLSSYSLPSRAMFQGDHMTVTLEANGSCWLDSRSTGRVSGSYDIDASRTVQPGCSNVTVTFNFGGQVMSGTLMWPTQGSLTLYFNGSVLSKVG